MTFAFPFLVASALAGGDVAPKPSEVRWSIGDAELEPVRTFDEGTDVIECGPTTLYRTSTAIAPAPPGAIPAWRVVGPESDSLAYLARAGDVAYFATTMPASNELRRLDVARGEWLAPRSWTAKELGLAEAPGTRLELASVVADERSLWLAAREIRPAGGSSEEEALVANVVARLDVVSGETRWARRFEASEVAPTPRAHLLAPMATAPVAQGVTPLTKVGDALVSCPGGTAPIALLDAASGETRWTLERLWEYQRGYVGPSVWAHFLGRFGVHELFGSSAGFVGEELRSLEDRRKNFEAAFDARVVDGPFVVRKRDAYGAGRRALLVVAAVMPRTQDWSEQLAQELVYEVDLDGRPCSVLSLPHATTGSSAIVLDDSVVLACRRGAFACVGSTSNDAFGGGFPGSGPDCLGRIVWARDLDVEGVGHWLASDPARDLVAFGTELALSTGAGGYVASKDSKEMRFPLWIVDLAEGSATSSTLRVPFDGALARPTTNYRGGNDGVRAWGWWGLALNGLQISGEHAYVSLANTTRSWTLEFQLAPLRRRR